MQPWVLLDTATIPGTDGTLRLLRRGTDVSIRLDAVELMTSRQSGSEEALADLACAALAGRAAPRILIGGLGLGFTLRAALAALPAEARIVVAELVPAVVAWARGPLADLFAGCLDDPRVGIVGGDVAAMITAAESAFDAILLDVDNGPAGQVRAANDGLYAARGLAAARRALAPDGVLGVWSIEPDASFEARFARSGFRVTTHRPRAHAGRGARHVVWLGQRA